MLYGMWVERKQEYQREEKKKNTTTTNNDGGLNKITEKGISQENFVVYLLRSW